MKITTVFKTSMMLFASSFAIQSVKAQNAAPSFGNDRILGNQTTNRFYIQSAPTNNGPYVQLNSNADSDGSQQGTIGLIAGYNGANANGIAFNYYTRTSNGGWTPLARMMQNGQMLFGTRSPNAYPGYKVAVDGMLVSQSIYVTSPTNWADFVFAPGYKSMSLANLENYLRHNKHLPAIPSANEVQTKGYNVTEMDAKLLQSVEELTLHVIEISKQNAQLKAEVNEIRAWRHTNKVKIKK